MLLPSGVHVGCAVLVVAVRDLLRLGRAVGRDDVEVAPPVAGPADAVELELEPREAPRRPLLVVLFLVRLVRDARARTRVAFRRATTPARRRPPSDRSGTAARRRRRASRRAGGAPSRRRASRRTRAASPSGDQRGCASFFPVVNAPRRLGAVRLREPDRLAVLVLLLVDRPDDVRDLVAARPQARVGDARERVDVLGPHPSHGAELWHVAFARMRVLVLGAGGVGAAVAAVAQRRDFFERIVFADVDETRARRAVERTATSASAPSPSTRPTPPRSPSSRAPSEADAILNAVDPRFNPPIFEAASRPAAPTSTWR